KLTVLEFGLALIGKSIHSLGLIFKRKQCMEGTAFKQQALLQCCFKGCVNGFLCCHNCRSRFCSDSLRNLHSRSKDCVVGYQTSHQTATLGLLTSHHPSSKHHIHSFSFANSSR